jgi:hypothetical protein
MTGERMSTDNPSSVSIQTDASPIASVPAWFGEVALLAHTLTRLGLLAEISERVRFVRKRFGTFEVIDFVVMLMGYAISGEPTLKAYYERLQPFASAFMALFGRSRLPHRATLSRFLAALDAPTVEALRSVFLHDALARLKPGVDVGGLWDRQATKWIVFDLDGTRQAARQRALPKAAGSATTATAFVCGLCARLHGAQAWGGRPHPDHAPTGPYPSVALHLWSSRQWRLSRRVVTGTHRDRCLSDRSGPSAKPSPRSTRWPLWQWGHHR